MECGILGWVCRLGNLSDWGWLMSATSGYAKKIEQLIEQRDSLRAVNAELLAELQNIANANPKTWDAEVRDQFMPWAKNRARAAIARATAQAGSALLENKS